MAGVSSDMEVGSLRSDLLPMSLTQLGVGGFFGLEIHIYYVLSFDNVAPSLVQAPFLQGSLPVPHLTHFTNPRSPLLSLCSEQASMILNQGPLYVLSGH